MNFVNCDFEPTYKNYIDASNEDLTDTIYRRELLSFFKCPFYIKFIKFFPIYIYNLCH